MLAAGTRFTDELVAALPELEVCRTLTALVSNPAPPDHQVGKPVRGLW